MARKKKVNWSRRLCLVLEHSHLSQSRICRITPVGCLAYVVLYIGYCLPPRLFCSPEAWMRGVTMSSCSNSTSKSSRHWTLDFLRWAEPAQHLGSPGLSTSAVCASPSALIPWAARQQEKGEVRNTSLSFFPFVCFKSLTKKGWRPQLWRNWKAKRLIFFFLPHRRPWVLNPLEDLLILFKCCDGRQRANEFCTWVGIQREESGDAGSKRWKWGVLESCSSQHRVYKPRSWKGFPEVLTSRLALKKMVQKRGS